MSENEKEWYKISDDGVNAVWGFPGENGEVIKQHIGSGFEPRDKKDPSLIFWRWRPPENSLSTDH